jgi:hypothetical protein
MVRHAFVAPRTVPRVGRPCNLAYSSHVSTREVVMSAAERTRHRTQNALVVNRLRRMRSSMIYASGNWSQTPKSLLEGDDPTYGFQVIFRRCQNCSRVTNYSENERDHAKTQTRARIKHGYKGRNGHLIQPSSKSVE